MVSHVGFFFLPTILLPILSLLQAAQPIPADQLQLDKIVAEKVAGTYKQIIRVNGNRLRLQTLTYRTESGIRLFQHDDQRTSISIPLDDWLRQNLSVLQHFVVANTLIPPDVPRTKEGTYLFKSVLERLDLILNLSKWCRFFKYDEDKAAYIEVPQFKPFGKGEFNLLIDITHVFIGPHKGGQHFSVSMHVRHITYKEDVKDTDQSVLIDELLKATAVDSVRKKKAKNSRKKAKDIDPCLSNISGVMASAV